MRLCSNYRPLIDLMVPVVMSQAHQGPTIPLSVVEVVLVAVQGEATQTYTDLIPMLVPDPILDLLRCLEPIPIPVG